MGEKRKKRIVRDLDAAQATLELVREQLAGLYHDNALMRAKFAVYQHGIAVCDEHLAVCGWYMKSPVMSRLSSHDTMEPCTDHGGCSNGVGEICHAASRSRIPVHDIV